MTDDFYRIRKLPPYVFAVVNEMKARLRAAQMDVVDLGMGNPDGPTPSIVVQKLAEAARNSRNHRYSMSRGIPNLRLEIVKRYKERYQVDLDAETEAIATIGAKDALAHLLFAVIGPGDDVAGLRAHSYSYSTNSVPARAGARRGTETWSARRSVTVGGCGRGSTRSRRCSRREPSRRGPT